MAATTKVAFAPSGWASWRINWSWRSWLRSRRPRVNGAQSHAWRSLKSAGTLAFRAGDLPQAEKHFTEALKMAEAFGFQDPRLAATLNNLALVYKRQEKFGKAEMCFRRAVRIYEAVRPRHIHTAHVLQNLAGLYAAQGKDSEAGALRARAQAIVGDS